MIRTIVFYPAMVISTLFFSSLGILCGLFGAGPSVFDRIHRVWSRSILGVAGARVQVEGLEALQPGRAQIFMVNHQSMFDIWSLMAAVPASLRFVAKEELARIPIFAGGMRAAGHVFIDRRKPALAGQAMRAAGERMKRDGLTLVLFPEGTRSGDGGLQAFRRGSFQIAIETQSFLIPVAIDGSGGILPRGGRRVRGGDIRIRLGRGTPLEGMTSADRDALVHETYDAMAGMLVEMRD